MASRSFMIKNGGSSIYARNGSARKPDQPAALRRKQARKSDRDKQQTKCVNDGRAQGQVPLEREKQPGHPTEQSDGPADKQTVGQGPSEIDPSNGGHNQVTENKQHAGDVERSW